MIFILLIITGILVAPCVNRKVSEVIPVLTFLIMLSSYFMAIGGQLSGSVSMGCVLLVILSVGAVAYEIITEKEYYLKKILSCLHPQSLVILIAGALAVIVLYRNHFVTNWDDFNYWAMFPKNIYLKDAFVTGLQNCTEYKDYTPIVQILYYVVFKSCGGFKECYMFMTNNILLLLCAVPFYTVMGEKADSKYMYAVKSMAGLLFPAAFMTQNFHSLGVDCIISMLFGYLLVYLLFDQRRDLFWFLNLSLGMGALALVKSTSVLCLMVIAVLLLIKTLVPEAQCDLEAETSGTTKAVKQSVSKAGKRKSSGTGKRSASKNGKQRTSETIKRDVMKSLAVLLLPIVSSLSWRSFCAQNNNRSYLSDKVAEGLGGGSAFPDYTAEFLRKFAGSICTERLNENLIAATPILCIVFCVFVAVMYYRRHRGRRNLAMIITVFAGFVAYVMALIYTYLFVFEEWEALSLSSFGRYIGLYLLGMVFLALYTLFEMDLMKKFSFGVILIMLVILNYSFLLDHFVPERYMAKYGSIYEKKTSAEKVFEQLYEQSPNLWGQRVLIVSRSRDDELTKYQQYAAVPSIIITYNLDERDEADIYRFADDHQVDVIVRQ